ncbi:uncharacterized protein LOC143207158 [Lasioglossum baleicum]|uniref:uncharacterized protein LOC143207158 n=1 Tax=Lasioglossum baleicum TaxID=434251 RepID=UPI003FCE2347
MCQDCVQGNTTSPHAHLWLRPAWLSGYFSNRRTDKQYILKNINIRYVLFTEYHSIRKSEGIQSIQRENSKRSQAVAHTETITEWKLVYANLYREPKSAIDLLQDKDILYCDVT